MTTDEFFGGVADNRATSPTASTNTGDLGITLAPPGQPPGAAPQGSTAPPDCPVTPDDHQVLVTWLASVDPVQVLELLRGLAWNAGTALIWSAVPSRAPRATPPASDVVRPTVSRLRATLGRVGPDTAGSYVTDLGREVGIEVSRSRFGSERGPILPHRMAPLRRRGA